MTKEFSAKISGGTWRGKTLQLPHDAGVRPSKTMVRQAVFNLLGSRVDITGARVADLCCGSGMLGFEAASRGAGEVWAVDIKPTAELRQNWILLGSPADVQLVTADARTWAPAEKVDIVLADPPYGKGLAQALLARREALGQTGSWWVVETGTDERLTTDGFTLVVERSYGQSRLWLLKQD